MKVADILLKGSIARAAMTLPLAIANEMAENYRGRVDYALRVLNAPRDIQIAVRDAAVASNRSGLKQLASLLNGWLAPQFTGIPNVTSLDIPAFLPTSIGQSAGTIVVNNTAGFPTAGKFRIQSSRGEQIITYTGKTQGQDFGSFTGCTGGNSASAGAGVVITEAPDYDISAAAVNARRATFIAAFTRRSQNAIGALNFINNKHIWSWDSTL